MPADVAEYAELKEMFNAARFRAMAKLLADEYPQFDQKKFLALALDGLAELTLIQRMRRMTEAMRATLPADYPAAITILDKVGPRIGHGFVSITLCDFVSVYGHDHFELSMAALGRYTQLGSAEFAIREFIKRDHPKTLAVMTKWSRHENEHLRRLASEGTRPRLPWSFRLAALQADPLIAWPILDALKTDESLYVRKSVANHLNDISHQHPEWLFKRLATWDASHPHTAWIIKRALRTLIKRGDPRALAMIGATAGAKVAVEQFKLTPARVKIGGEINFSFELTSKAKVAQRLVIDYVVHYMKKAGETSPKVFKLKEITLATGESLPLSKRHRLQELSTRKHHPGTHRLEVMVNGVVQVAGEFILSR
ncbi:DNA alkylation repair protein [Oleiharenicola lentus]|uniref:DNA alkylation repair protein n=1 Tax=Oleiharenicola lentus TaxID=2508720 RepID=UPI003F67F2A1